MILTKHWLSFGCAALCTLLIGATVTTGCGSRQTPKTEIDEPDSWRNRGIWVEKEGDRSYVKAVGVAPNASMGRTFAMPSAEQDARAKLSEYVGAAVKTFRERLARMDSSVGKDDDGDVTRTAQATQRNDLADRSTSDNLVRGMETVNTYVDGDSDELFVLARVDMEQLLASISNSDTLSPAERALVNSNSAQVRSEFEASFEQPSSR